MRKMGWYFAPGTPLGQAVLQMHDPDAVTPALVNYISVLVQNIAAPVLSDLESPDFDDDYDEMRYRNAWRHRAALEAAIARGEPRPLASVVGLADALSDPWTGDLDEAKELYYEAITIIDASPNPQQLARQKLQCVRNIMGLLLDADWESSVGEARRLYSAHYRPALLGFRSALRDGDPRIARIDSAVEFFENDGRADLAQAEVARILRA